MTPEGTITRDDFRDAIGWMYAFIHGDAEAKSALAGACDPVGMVDALATMYAGLILLSTRDRPAIYLDYMRDNLDAILEEGGL